MWHKDLSEGNFWGNRIPVSFTTVGWLENGKEFTTGNAPINIIERVYEFSRMPEMYQTYFGYHQCDFCEFVNIELGAKTIMIVYKSKVYFCPALITHYMDSHSYLPPSEFIEAVLNYDHQYAMEYFKQVRENRFSKIK